VEAVTLGSDLLSGITEQAWELRNGVSEGSPGPAYEGVGIQGALPTQWMRPSMRPSGHTKMHGRSIMFLKGSHLGFQIVCTKHPPGGQFLEAVRFGGDFRAR
jgi:hypothetical protein